MGHVAVYSRNASLGSSFSFEGFVMKVGDLVTQMFGRRVGIVIDLDLRNGEAFVMWASRNTWSELKYLEVI